MRTLLMVCCDARPDVELRRSKLADKSLKQERDNLRGRLAADAESHRLAESDSSRFTVASDYDYKQSTHANYAGPSAKSPSVSGAHSIFAGIRLGLDQAYHGIYSEARQHMQDSLVRRVVEMGAPAQRRPWIVFTAGAMGAGKSHTVDWM